MILYKLQTLWRLSKFYKYFINKKWKSILFFIEIDYHSRKCKINVCATYFYNRLCNSKETLEEWLRRKVYIADRQNKILSQSVPSNGLDGHRQRNVRSKRVTFPGPIKSTARGKKCRTIMYESNYIWPTRKWLVLSLYRNYN